MALEDICKDLVDEMRKNTDATNRLIAVSENMMKLRAEAIDTIKDSGKPSKKTTVKKDTPKRGITESPEDRKDPNVDAAGPSHDTLGETISAYVGMDDDKERRAERTATVRKIFGHKKVAAKTHKDVPDTMIATVISTVKKQHEEAIAAAAERESDSGDDDLLS